MGITNYITTNSAFGKWVQPKQSTLVKNFLKPNHLGHNGFKTTYLRNLNP